MLPVEKKKQKKKHLRLLPCRLICLLVLKLVYVFALYPRRHVLSTETAWPRFGRINIEKIRVMFFPPGSISLWLRNLEVYYCRGWLLQHLKTKKKKKEKEKKEDCYTETAIIVLHRGISHGGALPVDVEGG